MERNCHVNNSGHKMPAYPYNSLSVWTRIFLSERKHEWWWLVKALGQQVPLRADMGQAEGWFPEGSADPSPITRLAGLSRLLVGDLSPLPSGPFPRAAWVVSSLHGGWLPERVIWKGEGAGERERETSLPWAWKSYSATSAMFIC